VDPLARRIACPQRRADFIIYQIFTIIIKKIFFLKYDLRRFAVTQRAKTATNDIYVIISVANQEQIIVIGRVAKIRRLLNLASSQMYERLRRFLGARLAIAPFRRKFSGKLRSIHYVLLIAVIVV